MSKITKKRLYAILASLTCVLAVFTSTILVANAQVVDPSWLRYSAQGYSTLGYIVYDEEGRTGFEDGLPDRLCEVNIPLTHSTFPDAYYDGTTWDSQFYYSNYYDTEFDGSWNIGSRIEYMQNSKDEIPDPYYTHKDVQWGNYYGPTNTELMVCRQDNKVIFGDIERFEYDDPDHWMPTGICTYSMLHYSLRDVYLWHDDQFDGVIAEEASLVQLLRLPMSCVATELIGTYFNPIPGEKDFTVTYEDLVTIDGGVVSSILNVGTGEVFYDTCDLVIRPSIIADEYLIYADINLPDEEQDEDVEHSLYKLLDFDAYILVNRQGKTQSDGFNVYVENQYASILNVEEVERVLQRDSKVELPEFVDMGSWLAKGVAGFFNLPIVPGVTLGGILAVFVAFGVTMYLIKLFLGG